MEHGFLKVYRKWNADLHGFIENGTRIFADLADTHGFLKMIEL